MKLAPLIFLLLAGCSTVRPPALPPGEPVAAMISRPDFETAKKYAPAWTEQALHFLQDLTSRVKELEAR